MVIKAKRKRSVKQLVVLWSLLIVGVVGLGLPLGGYIYVTVAGVGVGEAYAAVEQESNPRADYWRAVREGVGGYTAVRGQETNVLIQNGGENWRQVRNGPISTYGAWVLALVVVAIAAFHIFVGKARLEQRSGEKVLRWTAFERLVHWFTAVFFLLHVITGLSLLYGRAVLIPLMGREAFAAYAEIAKDMHNYLAPFLIAGLAIMLLIWVRESLFTKVDWEWVKTGGGYLSSGHAHAGKVNAGEKVWFWLLFFVGIALCISGFYMLFPNYGFERETMQVANIVHAVSGVLLSAFSLGHIYLGLFGNEGALEGMIGGEVDAEWAKQHHDLWYQEVSQQQPQSAEGEGSSARPVPT